MAVLQGIGKEDWANHNMGDVGDKLMRSFIGNACFPKMTDWLKGLVYCSLTWLTFATTELLISLGWTTWLLDDNDFIRYWGFVRPLPWPPSWQRLGTGVADGRPFHRVFVLTNLAVDTRCRLLQMMLPDQHLIFLQQFSQTNTWQIPDINLSKLDIAMQSGRKESF